MPHSFALVVTDLVESTRLNEQLGDGRMSLWWGMHDQAARDLLRRLGGREVGRSDGFLALFGSVDQAIEFTEAYHRTMSGLPESAMARAAIHFGPVRLRVNSAEDVAQGSLAFDIDGLVLPVAMRLLSMAGPGHTLLSEEARAAMAEGQRQVCFLGHWMLKGVSIPVKVHGVVPGDGRPPLPLEGEKAYRVIPVEGGWAPARAIPSNIGPDLNAFVGRQAILADLAARFAGAAWLVCACGIGGVGKTRLARRFARSWLGEFPGGAWFCDIAPASERNGVMHCVAHSLGVALGREPDRQLAAAVASRGRCLLVLDNCEHLTSELAPLLLDWRSSAPEARFLVTSRHPLDVEGEEVLWVHPLEEADAVQLFEERARALGVAQGDAEESGRSIAALVQLLDCLPLAIELAAARSRLMTPAKLLEQAGERLNWPDPRRGRPARQATLWATLEWSWSLLSKAEQAALGQLSAFEGGFSLEAAEAIVVTADPRGDPAVVNLTQALVEKSLVCAPVSGRMELLGAVKDFAGEMASRAPADQAAALRRHATFFAGQADRHHAGPNEMANLAAAARRMAQAGEVDLALANLEGAWELLKLRGPFGSVLALATEVAAIPMPASARGRVERILAWACKACGRSADARAHFEAAIDHARQAGDVRTASYALSLLGDLLVNQGHMESARAVLEQALAAALATADATLECEAHTPLGNLHRSLGDYAGARAHYESALAAARRGGLRRWEGGTLGNLGMLAAEQGRLGEAHELCTSALSIARELGDRQWEANTLCNLGLLHHTEHRSLLAVEELEMALVAARQLGHVRLQAIVLCNLGLAAEELGQAAAAGGHYESALEVARALQDRRTEGQVLGYLGALHGRAGRFAQADRCLRDGQAHLEDIGDKMSLGLLLCARAECAWRAGKRDEMDTSLASAEALAVAVGAGEGSELLEALGRVRHLVSTAGPSGGPA
ncbi:ATP-binding protein [Ideonella sp. YS5]|uniref:ATP-binding protein n=1 Tax=Ideonella sp. YS5 TaxID=3453714 RepID=UPI003EEC56D6